MTTYRLHPSEIALSPMSSKVADDGSAGCSWRTQTAISDCGIPVTVTRIASTTGRFRISPVQRPTAALDLYVALPSRKSRFLIWHGGKTARTWLRTGDCIIYGMPPSQQLAALAPFDLLHLAIPRLGGPFSTAFSGKQGGHRFVSLGACQVSDPVVSGIAQLVATDLAGAKGGPSPHIKHLVSALLAHLQAQYTGEPMAADRPRRGLTSWQEHQAVEVLTNDVGDAPDIDAAAHACDLTPDRFVRLFKLTTGMPPHRWLRWYRVELAKRQLLDTGSALSEIAFSCGFSDQSHFTRVFTAWTGLTPGEWRRRAIADHPSGP